MADQIFISATDARQSPIREHVIHTEGRLIENAVLDAVRYGLFSVIVNDGTPMTQSSVTTTTVTHINTYFNTFEIPNHPYGNGAVVQLSSSTKLPDPLSPTAKYYVIYIDPNHIKLAATLPDALAYRSISIDMGQAVNSITLVNPGEGYIQAPFVTISGGNATVDATATATLASYGSINSIGVINPGGGYTDIPSMTISPLGGGAVAGVVTMGLIGATPAAGGTSYNLNDTLGVVGGAGAQATVIVTRVGTNGAVLAVGLVNAGAYTTMPNLVACSTNALSGNGSGCTLNLTMGVISIALAAGGSNYVTAPLVVINGTGAGATATAAVSSGVVYQVTVTNTGSGYTAIPTVSFLNGEFASAMPILQATGIGNITVTNNGSNTYTSSPNVTIDPIGSGALSGQVYMSITLAKCCYPGQGYLKGDVVTISGGICSSQATILVRKVGPQGEIFEYSLINSGSYSTLPTMDEVGVTGGTGYSATFNLRASVYGIDVLAGGSGYIAPPTVTITDDIGMCAAAIANLSNGVVSSFTITSMGQCYKHTPTVDVSNGENAVVIPYLYPTSVASFIVSNTGSGYTTANVVVTGSSNANANATGTVIISNGEVTGITLVSGGSGYTGTPNVTINGDGNNAVATALLVPTALDYISIFNGGSGFNISPNVTISGNATATASLFPTGIAQVVILNNGDSYTSNPVVTINPSPNQDANVTITPPSLVTTLGYAVGSISITDGGAGYTSVPTVSLSAPQDDMGVVATAIANIGVGGGTITVGWYPPSLDYYAVWKGYTVSDPSVIRPYQDRMSTIINYFTNYGYTITQQTNPATGNTMQWFLQW